MLQDGMPEASSAETDWDGFWVAEALSAETDGDGGWVPEALSPETDGTVLRFHFVKRSRTVPQFQLERSRTVPSVSLK